MDARIQRALDLVARDYSCPLRLKDVAGAVGLSVSRFNHLFKQDVGVAPAKYVRSVRLSKARELLGTSLSVKEIMSSVGFSDESHAVREFKRQYGRKPSDVRRKKLAISANKEALI